jgi:hypothetical protein
VSFVYALIVLIGPAVLSVVTVLKSVVKPPSQPAILFVVFVTIAVGLQGSGVVPLVVTAEKARETQQFFATAAQVIAALWVALALERALLPGSDGHGESDAGDVRTRVGATGSVGILMSVVAAMLALIPGWWELALNVALILALGGMIAAATASLIIALPSRKLTRAESSGQDGSTFSVVRELVGTADRPSGDARTNAQPAASGVRS